MVADRKYPGLRCSPAAIARLSAFVWVFVLSLCFTAAAQRGAQGTSEFDRVAAQASQARDANDLESAHKLYRKALAMRPAWAEGWWSLGTILYDRDKFAEAARAFARVVSLQPGHGSARVMLGLCEFELGQDDKALRDIEAGKRQGVLKDIELRHVMLYHEGVLLLRKGRFEAAQQILDSLSQDGARNDELLAALGMSVLRVLPANLPPVGSTAREIVLRSGRAEGLAASKSFEEAHREYSSLVSEYPDTPNLHYAFGRFLLEMHEIDPAIAEFRQEIANNPGHVLARLEIAAARYRVDSADGLKYAQEAVRLDPQRSFGHYLLGLLYLDTQNLSASILELEIARRAHPDLPEIYFALGNAYARSGRKPEAARARATFTRLNARRAKETTDSVYGEHPPMLRQEQLDPDSHPEPRL